MAQPVAWDKGLIALGSQDSDFEVVAAIDWDQNPNIGKDAGCACWGWGNWSSSDIWSS